MAFALAASLVAGDAVAALSFRVLDACQPVQEVIRRLEHGPDPSRACRQPRSDLEKQYAARLERRGMSLCLLREPPSPLLDEFSCVGAVGAGGHSIICFRSAALSEVAAYKSNYGERDAVSENRYLGAASACPASTGDAARVGATMFPGLLAEVAAFELGYVTQLRPSGDGFAVVVHGYARTDPELRGNIPSALEFVSFSTGASTSVTEDEEIRQIGDWTLRVADDAALAVQLEGNLRQQHVDARLEIAHFYVEKHRGDRAGDDKASRMRQSGRAISRHLQAEGFEAVPAATFKAQTGLNKRAVFDLIRNNMPYGIRNNLGGDMDFDLLLHNSVPACQHGKSGAIGAYILRTKARADVRSDYGAIDLILLAVGDCARQKSVHQYVTNILMEVGDALGESLVGSQ